MKISHYGVAVALQLLPVGTAAVLSLCLEKEKTDKSLLMRMSEFVSSLQTGSMGCFTSKYHFKDSNTNFTFFTFT